MRMSLVTEIAALIRSELAVEEEEMDLHTPLFAGGLELDSFAVVELITLMEKRWGFQFSDDDFLPENFETLGTLSAMVERYLDAPRA